MPLPLRTSMSIALSREHEAPLTKSIGYTCRDGAASDMASLVRTVVSEPYKGRYTDQARALLEPLYTAGWFSFETSAFRFTVEQMRHLCGWFATLSPVYPGAKWSVRVLRPKEIVASVSQINMRPVVNDSDGFQSVEIAIEGNGDVVPMWWWTTGIARAYHCICGLSASHMRFISVDIARLANDPDLTYILSASKNISDAWYRTPSDAERFIEVLNAVRRDGDSTGSRYFTGIGPVGANLSSAEDGDNDDYDDGDDE